MQARKAPAAAVGQGQTPADKEDHDRHERLMQDKATPWRVFSKPSRTDKPNVASASGSGRSSPLPTRRASKRIARSSTSNPELLASASRNRSSFHAPRSSILRPES
jgi:hypothetical protein